MLAARAEIRSKHGGTPRASRQLYATVGLRRLLSIGSILFCLGGLSCAGSGASVTRIARGIEYQGREVSDAAYANYARGAVWEAEGHYKEALQAYSDALSDDPGAPELLVRLGAVRCKLGGHRDDALRRQAIQDFERALRWDPESALAFEELSRCRSRNGEAELALSAALDAFTLDPQNERLSVWVAQTAEAAGNLDLSRSWLDATVTWHPSFADGWLALARFARSQRDAARALRAQRGLQRLGRSRLHLGRSETANLEKAQLGPPKDARSAPNSNSALPALELTDKKQAAERAFAANPDDSNAWVTLLVAADLERRLDDLNSYLRAAPADPSPFTSDSARSYADLLERLAGSSSREIWVRQRKLEPAASKP